MIGAAALTAAPARAATPVYDKVVGLGSNQCLDVARVQQWACNAQLFKTVQ